MLNHPKREVQKAGGVWTEVALHHHQYGPKWLCTTITTVWFMYVQSINTQCEFVYKIIVSFMSESFVIVCF